MGRARTVLRMSKKPPQPRPGKKPRIGECRICGTRGVLTFEHVPPKTAFNRNRVELHTMEDWLQRDAPGPKKKGRIQQRGMGGFILCDSCNNLTGRRYVPELERWTRAAVSLLGQLPDDDSEDADPNDKAVSFEAVNVRPLLFAKQVAAMIMAVNGGEFRKRNLPLAEFVLDPEKVGLPVGYDIYLALYRGPNARQSGVSGRANVAIGRVNVLSEVAHPPFAYLMSFDEEEPALPVGKVTHFADYGSHDVVDQAVEVLVGFGHTPFPGDYRSRARIDLEAEEDRAAVAEMEPEEG